MSDANSQRLSALVRALISGCVDSYALLNFGVFASFMTGDTTTVGLNAGQANLAAAGHSLLPIPFFLLGILSGTLVVRADRQHALRRLSVLLAGMARHHATQQRHGSLEHLGHPSRRSGRKPRLHDRRLEQPRAAPRPGYPARARGSGPRFARHPLAPGRPAGQPVDILSRRSGARWDPRLSHRGVDSAVARRNIAAPRRAGTRRASRRSGPSNGG